MLALLAAASVALAAEPAQPSPSVVTLTPEQAADAVAAANEPAPEWYGWQTLFMDGLSLGCLLGSSTVSSGEDSLRGVLLLCGIGLYTFGGPSVHLGHGDGLMALIDVAMRVALPVATVLTGMAFGAFGSGWDVLSYGALGLGLGMLISVAADAFGLAYEPVPQVPPAHASIQWAPFLGAAHGAPVAGLAGAF